ncbi:MAG TPA: GerMN domain-containing protein [Nocardioides sp.]|jgi:hypothetical protein|uniref:GerMN domain-containing protein n=1 Tax=Nocardioides sp. TaxID=35761 RepID=UPI002C5D1578|nr:GerMN domain-containing protein [Nocardioides sp.]HTW13968.1 GerMN domain-containing protein [Nocardioides sp.]
MTGTPRRRRRAAGVLGVIAAVLLSSCGLPGEGNVRRVDDDVVPYRLLEPASSQPGVGDRRGRPRRQPLIFWLLPDSRLVPAVVPATCEERPSAVVTRLLRELAAGPRDDARAAGRSTALPPESTLVLRRVRDGVAEVEVDPETAISADRLPAAVGQVVLTAISTSGVRAVLFVNGGTPVRVPLPGGALVDRPVTAADYKELLPAWFQHFREPGCSER